MEIPQGRAWCLAALAVAGAFTLGGMFGVLSANAIGVWELPSSGFCAAFAVVGVAYFAAPLHKRVVAACAFAAGAVVAWLLLKDSFYPEYHLLAYQSTYVPLVATYAGGLFALALTALQQRR